METNETPDRDDEVHVDEAAPIAPLPDEPDAAADTASTNTSADTEPDAAPAPLAAVQLAPVLFHRLELAQGLPEVGADSACEPYESNNPNEIISFKSADRRTMRIVVLDGGFAAQEVI